LLASVPGFYDYAISADPAKTVEWHLNFADPHLFAAYAGPLFAQDEMQVAEHPALGALREQLKAEGLATRTVDQAGPTPVLVSGVERRVTISSEPDISSGRPRGLYGHEFAAASPQAVSRAVRRIEPPSISNLIALAAPYPGRGHYDRATIESILVTAYTGFAAARLESVRLRLESPSVSAIVHSGYWGCGAFGGNRILMVLLQVIAARMAGLDRLVIHTGRPGGAAPFTEAAAMFSDLARITDLGTADLISVLVDQAFAWGASDGN
jgi:hypothetical protein